VERISRLKECLNWIGKEGKGKTGVKGEYRQTRRRDGVV